MKPFLFFLKMLIIAFLLIQSESRKPRKKWMKNAKTYRQSAEKQKEEEEELNDPDNKYTLENILKPQQHFTVGNFNLEIAPLCTQFEPNDDNADNLEDETSEISVIEESKQEDQNTKLPIEGMKFGAEFKVTYQLKKKNDIPEGFQIGIIQLIKPPNSKGENIAGIWNVDRIGKGDNENKLMEALYNRGKARAESYYYPGFEKAKTGYETASIIDTPEAIIKAFKKSSFIFANYVLVYNIKTSYIINEGIQFEIECFSVTETCQVDTFAVKLSEQYEHVKAIMKKTGVESINFK